MGGLEKTVMEKDVVSFSYNACKNIFVHWLPCLRWSGACVVACFVQDPLLQSNHVLLRTPCGKLVAPFVHWLPCLRSRWCLCSGLCRAGPLTTKQPRLAAYALWEARRPIVQCMHGYQRFHVYARGRARVGASLCAGRYIPKHSRLAA